MKKISFEVSDSQYAVLTAFSKTMRVSIEETTRCLAFMQVATGVEEEEFRAHFEGVLEKVARGDVDHSNWYEEYIPGLRSVPKPVTVNLTQPQIERLGQAAAVIGHGVTAEDIIVSGALSTLDISASSLEDGVEAFLGTVEAYARQRVAFAEPDHGTHPLQSFDKQTIDQN